MPPSTDYSGKISEKKFLTEDVMFLSFQVPASFSFTAGQYIVLKVVQDETVRWKSYSILNPPSQKEKIDLCITIIPGGFASEYFKRAQIGEKVSFRGPVGYFVFDTETENNEQWFICAGTGLTPFYSMIGEHLPTFPEKKFVLLFGERTQKDLLFHEKLRQLEQNYPHFTYIPTLSREQWNGKRGRVQAHLPSDLEHKTFYICGLKELVLETKELLASKGVAAENIKVERYT